MKLIHRVIGLFFFIILLGSGLMLFWAAVSEKRWADFIAVFGGSRLPAIPVTLAIICLVLMYVISAFPGDRRVKYLSFRRNGGAVSISTEAIAEYIAKLSGEFQSVVRMNPVVIPHRDTVDILVDVHIKAGPQIREECQALQERIRDSLATGLGISGVRDVEVSVVGIISDGRKG